MQLFSGGTPIQETDDYWNGDVFVDYIQENHLTFILLMNTENGDYISKEVFENSALGLT